MQEFLIPCTIERGGFSSERTFELPHAQGKLVGMAFVEHLFDENRQPLADENPSYGEQIRGFVKCRVIERFDSRVLVEVPSTDVINVPQDELQPFSA
ncbi:MAG: hypothetical protein KY476_13525 [Planctomycetes bacterium]|nr:hypothetical protein [Planctomycetota bacterium]